MICHIFSGPLFPLGRAHRRYEIISPAASIHYPQFFGFFHSVPISFPLFVFFLIFFFHCSLLPHTLASITALYLTPPFRSLSCAAWSPSSFSGNFSIFALTPCRMANSNICNIIRRDPWAQGRKASDFSKAGSAGNEISPRSTVTGYIVPNEAIKSINLACHVRQ